jgi:hypothetical protein
VVVNQFSRHRRQYLADKGVSTREETMTLSSTRLAPTGVTDGSNLKLAGNFAYTPDDVLAL